MMREMSPQLDHLYGHKKRPEAIKEYQIFTANPRSIRIKRACASTCQVLRSTGFTSELDVLDQLVAAHLDKPATSLDFVLA